MKPPKINSVKFISLSLFFICILSASFILVGRIGTYSWFTANSEATGTISVASIEDITYETINDNGTQTIINPTKIKIVFFPGVSKENVEIQIEDCEIDTKDIWFQGSTTISAGILDKTVEYISRYNREGNLEIEIPIEFILTDNQIAMFGHPKNYDLKKEIDNSLYVTFNLSCFKNEFIKIKLPKCTFKSSYLKSQ